MYTARITKDRVETGEWFGECISQEKRHISSSHCQPSFSNWASGQIICHMLCRGQLQTCVGNPWLGDSPAWQDFDMIYNLTHFFTRHFLNLNGQCLWIQRKLVIPKLVIKRLVQSHVTLRCLLWISIVDHGELLKGGNIFQVTFRMPCYWFRFIAYASRLVGCISCPSLPPRSHFLVHYIQSPRSPISLVYLDHVTGKTSKRSKTEVRYRHFEENFDTLSQACRYRCTSQLPPCDIGIISF